MAVRQTTPRELAKRANCEIDDVLILLWDAGIDYPSGPETLIKPQHVSNAERACGLAGTKQKTTVEYWTSLLGVDRQTFTELATAQHIHIGPNARRLPKGALAKLERGAFSSEQDRPVVRSVIDPKPVQKVVLTPFVWENVGHLRESLSHLSAEDIESIHYEIAEDFRNSPDPISPAGVRDANLLESAAGRPQTGMADLKKYPTVELAAAALMHSVVHNHPFYNGNKRTALVSMMSFLDRNNFTLNCAQDDLFRWTLRVASHGLNRKNLTGDKSDIEVVEMARWICSNSRMLERGERVITWRVLRKRLTAFECEMSQSGTQGGRMTITRHVSITKRGVFKARERTEERRYILPYGGDGRQVSRSRLKELRRELQLSDEFGVDSATFYGNDSSPIDEFISLYRKTLSRLARV